MHGGKIAGSSEGEGLGSTFTIELPLFTKDYTARSRTDYNSTSPERLNESPSGNFSMSKIGLTVRAALGLQQGANRRSKEMSEPSLLNHRVVLQDMSEYGGSQSNRISGNASTRMLARTASGRSTDNKSWRSTGSKPPAPRSNLSSPDTQHRKQWREGSRQAESPINPNTRSIAQTLKGLIKGDQNVQTKASGHSNRIVQTSESNSLLKGPSLSDLLVPNPTNVENSFHDLLNQDSMKSSGSRIEHDLVGENIHAIPKPIGLDKTLTGFDLSMASLASMDTSPDRYEDSLSRITPKTNQIYPVTGSFLERCEVQNQRTIESTIKHAEDKPPEPVLSEHANDDSLKEDHNMTLDKTAKSDKSWETGLTILIVDDSAPNRKMLRKLLTNGGHKVYDCYDGVDCLEKLDYLDEHSFGLKSSLPDIDVILMDEHMPRMNGPEATKILVDRGFAGVIYAVTGTVGNEDASNVFLKSGAEAVFCKPLNMELLKQQVNRYFQKLRLQKTIHEKNQKAPPKS